MINLACISKLILLHILWLLNHYNSLEYLLFIVLLFTQRELFIPPHPHCSYRYCDFYRRASRGYDHSNLCHIQTKRRPSWCSYCTCRSSHPSSSFNSRTYSEMALVHKIFFASFDRSFALFNVYWDLKVSIFSFIFLLVSTRRLQGQS